VLIGLLPISAMCSNAAVGGTLFSRSCRLAWVSLAVSSLQLCASATAVEEYLLEGKVEGSASINDSMNATQNLWGADRQLTSGLNCSLFERFVEATRRRRSRRSLQNFVNATRRKRLENSLQHSQILPDEPDIPLLSNDAWIKIWSGVGMSFLAGLSTTIGAGVIFILPDSHISPAQMSFVLAFAGGVMVSATVLEFWLPAISPFCVVSMMRVLACSGIGALFFFLLKFVPEPSFGDVDIEQCTHNSGESCKAQVHSWHLAKVLLLSLTAHNFPEGFAVAVSSFGSSDSGFIVTLAMAMHNIPEGISIAVPVLAATGSRTKALWMTLLSGMAEPVGAIVAVLCMHAMGNITYDWIESLLCVVGGIMVAVAGMELLPHAWSVGKPRVFVAGSLMGVFLMILTIMCGA